VSKKKILCIVQLPPPVHGVSLMNEYVINSRLLNENFDIRAIDLKFGKAIKDLEKFTFTKVYKSFTSGLQIVRNIVVFKPDLVYFTIAPAGFAFYRDAFYVLLMKLFRSRILLHLHGKGIKRNTTDNNFKKNFYRLVLKKTKIICLSTELSKDIEEVYDDVPFIVPNGIKDQPNSEFKTIPSSSTVRILYLSNFIKNKGILILLDALITLKNQGLSFKASLVGAPSNVTNNAIEEIITKNDLSSSVKIVGPLMGDDKFDAYREADLFVFPTYNDAFPLVTLEAMQFGLPVISTFEGSIPDIVLDNETGILVERENANMLAEKIAVLLKDVSKMKTMGENGRRRFVNNYTLEHFENNIDQVFNRILNPV
jgi:glycosyltransferase involved in cell wall biosynthesis